MSSSASGDGGEWDSGGDPKLECIKEKINEMANLNSSNGKITKSQFAVLIGNVVAEVEFCLCNATDTSTLLKSNRKSVVQLTQINTVFKRESKIYGCFIVYIEESSAPLPLIYSIFAYFESYHIISYSKNCDSY